MNRLFRRALVIMVVALAVVGSAQTKSQTSTKASTKAKPSAAATPPKLEAKALDVLKATSAKLAAAQTVAFDATEIFEHPSLQGDPLAYATKYEVKMQRPDKLRVIIFGDGPASEFYYNGKTMAAFAPAENLVAVADAPSTVDATLEAAYVTAGIYFPFEDILVADPYKDMQVDLQFAYYIGQSHVIGGTTTDIVAYVDGGVFIQLWVGTEDKLPRMIRAVYLDDPRKLRHELHFSNWQLGMDLPAQSFEAVSAANAKQIKFAHPNPLAPAAAKPAAKTPAKAKATTTN